MNDTLPPGPYLVVGCGRAGFSAAQALRAQVQSSEIRVWDANDGPQTRRRGAILAGHGIRVDLGQWRPDLLEPPYPGTVVKSPGVPSDCAPISAAIAAGVPVIDELALGSRLNRRRLIAVTGTDGKSTVSELLARAMGGVDDPLLIAGNTEFGPPLSAAPRDGGPIVVEASSYQLEFCESPFAELAVLTNVTEEHLHRHGTMSAYTAAKRRLFLGNDRHVPRAAVNVDSDFGRQVARDLGDAGATVAPFGSSARAHWRVLEATWDVGRSAVRLGTPSGEVRLSTMLPGWHNAENVAAALAVCDLLELTRTEAIAAIEATPGVRGRWEQVDCGQPFDVVVDFAHTPAALSHVLQTARRVVTERGGRVHLMLCAGGGNNPGKRRPLGAIASRLADRVIVTEGNGRGEPRERVIAGLLAGWGPAVAPQVVPDRRAAIREVLIGARAGDVVVLMGRGAMPRLLADASGAGPLFDDRQVAEEEFDAIARDLSRAT